MVSEQLDREVLAVVEEPSDEELENPMKKRKENLHTIYSASCSELLGRDRSKDISIRAEVETRTWILFV